MNEIKGAFKGSCNVTACQKKYSAFYYNFSTRKYYCESCANKINDANKKESMDLFGHDLCILGDYEEWIKITAD